MAKVAALLEAAEILLPEPMWRLCRAGADACQIMAEVSRDEPPPITTSGQRQKNLDILPADAGKVVRRSLIAYSDEAGHAFQ